MAVVRVVALLVVLGIATAKPYFQLVEANTGSPSRKRHTLSNNFEYCPTSLAAAISLECVAAGASYAELYVNGAKARRENVAPFMVAGDTGGNSRPWAWPRGSVTLKCVTNTGEVEVRGKLSCGTKGPAPSPSSSAGTPAPPTTPTAPIGVHRKYCILIPATTHTNERSDKWVLQDDGKSLTYRPGDPYPYALPPSTARLYYEFEVPVASRYGFTMASRTIDKTEHNDIWITFPDGMSLIRQENGKISDRQDNLKGPLKSYHNAPNKYSKIALSVDKREHTFCSTKVLVPGRKYTIIVGARSTQFQFYGLIAFPSTEEQCWIWGDWFQTKYLPTCHLP